MLLAQRSDRGAHGRSRCETIIDKDHGAARHVEGSAIAAIDPLTPFQLFFLSRYDSIDRLARQSQVPDDVMVHHASATGRYRAHGKLLLAGHAELADDEHIERSV